MNKTLEDWLKNKSESEFVFGIKFCVLIGFAITSTLGSIGVAIFIYAVRLVLGY